MTHVRNLGRADRAPLLPAVLAFLMTSAAGLGCDDLLDSCDTDADCPEGATCSGCAGKHCNMPDTCTTDEDCDVGEECVGTPGPDAEHPFEERPPPRAFCAACDEDDLDCGSGGAGGAR